MSDLIKRLRGKYSSGPEGIKEDRDFGSYTPRICVEAAERIEELEAQLEVLRLATGSMRGLIDASDGVTGLHLNGDIAPWSELERGGRFEEWLYQLNVSEDVRDK